MLLTGPVYGDPNIQHSDIHTGEEGKLSHFDAMHTLTLLFLSHSPENETKEGSIESGA